MLGMNMSTALAFAVCFTLLASLLRRGLRQEGRQARPDAARSWEGVAPQPRRAPEQPPTEQLPVGQLPTA
jgi:hypothetical protein